MRALNMKIRSVTSVVLILVVMLTVLTIAFPAPKHTQAANGPLQIGWFTGAGVNDMTRIDIEKAAGETLQFAYYDTTYSPATYLTKLQQANIKVYLELDFTAVRTGDMTTVLAVVNAWKSNPAIAGWMLYDEPDNNGVPSSVLIPAYNAIKAADPNHPVALILVKSDCSYVGKRSEERRVGKEGKWRTSTD